MNFFHEYFTEIFKCTSSMDVEQLAKATDLIKSAGLLRGKVILVGNGGSAAIASHVAVDFVKVAGIRAINFNEADLITCLANDYGYEHWVEQALEFYAEPQDLVILISSSGQSPNIVKAALKAHQMKLQLITFSGFSPNNPLRELGDINFWADSSKYNIVEMTHHIWLVALSDRLAIERGATP